MLATILQVAFLSCTGMLSVMTSSLHNTKLKLNACFCTSKCRIGLAVQFPYSLPPNDVTCMPSIPTMHYFFQHSLVSLVPRPCAFVAYSTKFAQRAWARSSRDVCRSRNFTSHQIWPRRVAALVVEITTNGVGRT